MKKILSVLLILLMTFNCFSYSYAALPEDNEIVQPMYSYVTQLLTDIAIENNVATCKIYAKGINGTTTKIEIDLTLQKKTALWWSTVEAWEVNYLQYTAQHSRTFSVNSGTYRLKAVYKVYSGTNYETITEYSGTKSC